MISSDTFFGGIKESTFLGVVPPKLCVQNTETNVHMHIESYITSQFSSFHQRLNFYLTSKLNFADSSYWTYLTFSYWNFRHFMDFPLSAIFFLIFYWHFFGTNFQVLFDFFLVFLPDASFALFRQPSEFFRCSVSKTKGVSGVIFSEGKEDKGEKMSRLCSKEEKKSKKQWKYWRGVFKGEQGWC